MVDYREAYKIAKKLKPSIDACDEYDTGYLFSAKADQYMIGGDGPCIILKDDGKAINMTEFIDEYRSTFIREIPIIK